MGFFDNMIEDGYSNPMSYMDSIENEGDRILADQVFDNESEERWLNERDAEIGEMWEREQKIQAGIDVILLDIEETIEAYEKCNLKHKGKILKLENSILMHNEEIEKLEICILEDEEEIRMSVMNILADAEQGKESIERALSSIERVAEIQTVIGKNKMKKSISGRWITKYKNEIASLDDSILILDKEIERYKYQKEARKLMAELKRISKK